MIPDSGSTKTNKTPETSLAANASPLDNHHHHNHHSRAQKSIPGIIFRFSGWAVGFAGLFAMGGTCPFCGQQGCPVGTASASIIGLTFASLIQWGKRGLSAIRTLLRLK
jgi:hypothetical protein